MKPPVSFFVSYAHADDPQADVLLGLLWEQMAPSKLHDYQLWQDKALLLGEDWDEEIHAALESAQFGLLLLSPKFLVSDYIRKHELAHFLTKGKPVIPVMLKTLDFGRHDLLGLEKKQIFRLREQAFASLTGEKRREFAETLFAQIDARLEKLLAAPTS